MKYKKVLFLSTVIIVLFLASVSFAAIPIDVTVGKETILKLKEPSKRVSIANPDVAEVIVISPSEIVINGKETGITSLIIWNMQGQATFFDVIVYKDIKSLSILERQREETIDKEIRDALKNEAPNIDLEVKIVGDTIVLHGTAHNRQVIDKIESIAMLFAPKDCEGISSRCSISASEGCIAEKGSEAKGGGGSILPIVPLGEGLSGGETQAGVLIEQKTERKALCVLNLITIPNAQQVILEVIVAQIRKTKLKELGISFVAKGIQDNAEITFPGLYATPDGSIGGSSGLDVTPGIGGFDLEFTTPQIGFAHFPSGIGVVLRALQEKGYSKILAEPNMVVRSGEKGIFKVGTEVPIQTILASGGGMLPTVEYKDVGIELIFAPEVLETDAIRLKIDTAKVSSIIRYLTFGGIIAPEIDKREVRTSVDLREGESLILAGLLSDDMRKSINKIPVLGDIPILGALFRQTREELEQNELAFFITPRLVKPFAPGFRPELPTDKEMTPDEEKEFEWIPMPRAAGK